MKKIILFILTLAVFLLPLSGCKEEKSDVIRVNEVTDSFFYAPFYLAIEKGFFKDEGLEIELTNGGGSDVSMTALLSGGADVILAGPETAVYIARQNKKDAPKVFAQLTKRDGCFLIGRNPEPDFKWDNLKGKEIIIGRKGGLPAMTFEYTIKNKGLSDYVSLRTDIQFPLMGPTFDGGTGDYVTLFEPTATEFVSAGKGYIVASVGKESGEIPYTSFIALESFLKTHGDKAEKFVTALYKALEFIKEQPSQVVAEYLIKHFKGSELESTAKSLDNYKSVDTWMTDMSLSETMFNKLLDVISSSGEDVEGVKYSSVVDNTIASK
ncbi:MAG: ABC transporter substrate-binding protein, partial [Clostridia bacterium]|nr:ABC transporter substrate-binding protein [Clostridia bacterium]